MNKKEQENLDILEPAIAIIITNLENISELFENNYINNKSLEKLINEFVEMDDFSKWENNNNKLKSQRIELEKNILSLNIEQEEKIKYLNFLVSAIIISENFLKDGFIINNINEDIVEDELFLQDLQDKLVTYFNDNFIKLNSIISSIELSDSNTHKMLEVLETENDFNEIKQGSDLLLNIIVFETAVNFEEKIDICAILNKVNVLIEWFEICSQQDNIEEE